MTACIMLWLLFRFTAHRYTSVAVEQWFRWSDNNWSQIGASVWIDCCKWLHRAARFKWLHLESLVWTRLDIGETWDVVADLVKRLDTLFWTICNWSTDDLLRHVKSLNALQRGKDPVICIAEMDLLSHRTIVFYFEMTTTFGDNSLREIEKGGRVTEKKKRAEVENREKRQSYLAIVTQRCTFKFRKLTHHLSPPAASCCWTVYPNWACFGPLMILGFFVSILKQSWNPRERKGNVSLLPATDCSSSAMSQRISLQQQPGHSSDPDCFDWGPVQSFWLELTTPLSYWLNRDQRSSLLPRRHKLLVCQHWHSQPI